MKITVTEVLEEGNWAATAWSPRIANDAAFQTFIAGLIGRASAYVEWRVGSTNYASTAEPLNLILKEAEMHICQEQVLLSAAEIADSAADSTPAPFIGTGADLRAQAQHRRARAEELLCPYDQHPSCCFARPYARTGLGAERVSDYRFDEQRGRLLELC